jgi:hypothetical protein
MQGFCPRHDPSVVIDNPERVDQMPNLFASFMDVHFRIIDSHSVQSDYFWPFGAQRGCELFN